MAGKKLRNLDWFKNWFDSSYYHILYRHRNSSEAKTFIDNILEHIQTETGSRILDLACGKGRHSLYLNQKGFDVVGVDLSQNSIKEAKLHENSTLNFYTMDMRELKCNKPFHIVMNLFTSFGYFDNSSDNIKVLEGIHSVLYPSGILVIDFLNATKVIRNLVPEETQTIDHVVFTITRHTEYQTVVKTIKVKDGNQKHIFQERVSMFELADFRSMFKQTGFHLIAHFGNYNLEEYDPNLSDRLILIAQKSC